MNAVRNPACNSVTQRVTYTVANVRPEPNPNPYVVLTSLNSRLFGLWLRAVVDFDHHHQSVTRESMMKALQR